MSEENIITTGRCQRVPKKCDSLESYGLTNTSKDMDVLLMAQTTYIASMETVSQVDEAVTSAVNYITLTQMGMKKGAKLYGKAGVRSILREMK